MRALIVVAVWSSTARAEPWLPVTSTLCRRVDTGTVQLGAGIAGRRFAGELGYSVTDHVIVQARERLVAHELEADYRVVYGKYATADALFVARIYLVGGSGVTNDGVPTAHAGLLLRTYPSGSNQWFALEVGVREAYASRTWSTEWLASVVVRFPGDHFGID